MAPAPLSAPPFARQRLPIVNRQSSIVNPLGAACLVALACVTFAQAREKKESEKRPLAEQGYAGLVLSDHPGGTFRKPTGGCLVHWILPGPLKGNGPSSPFLARGDLVLAVNGKAGTTEELADRIRSLGPGAELTLKVRHTQAAPDANPLVPGPGEKEEEFRVKLASRAEWSGPLANFRPADRPLDPASVLPDVGQPPPAVSTQARAPGPHVAHAAASPLEEFVRGELKSRHLDQGVAKLFDQFADRLDRQLGYHMLNRVTYAFERPFGIKALQEHITAPLAQIPGDPRGVLLAAADNLEVKRPALGEAVDLTKPVAALEEAAARVGRAAALLDEAFGGLEPATRDRLPADLDELLQWVAQGRGIAEHPEAARMIRVTQASMKVNYEKLLAAAGALAGFLRKVGTVTSSGSPVGSGSRTGQIDNGRGEIIGGDCPRGPAAGTPSVPIPQELAGAVTGPILAALKKDDRWYVYGGPGANTYDLSRVAVVFDAGGDDRYICTARPPGGIQVVVDLGGDDRYEGAVAGPASGILGVSLVVDYSGSDFYAGPLRSCGAGVMGVGILLDWDGNDEYHSRAWSQGAAFYGVGALLDIGNGGDVHISQTMSQGLGGPRGFGLLLDQGGSDLYRANGPQKSAYGSAACYYACSQGVGFGLRNYDSGGIGILADLSGDDRYEAGEFAQGGGYYWGLGILYDREGNDLYSGTRYAQGWAAHSAVGVLADDAGDDCYCALQVAAQGAAWDFSVALLLDKSGNDSYQAAGLCQGSAAMQAFGWLLDLGGRDRYVSSGPSAQGQAGENFYHYEDTGAFSFALLLDAGGGEDIFSCSTERRNNKTLSTGALNAEHPEKSDLYGLFVDTKKELGN